MSFPYSRTLFSSAQSLFSELENKYLGYDLMVQSKLTEFIIMLIRESRLSENREKAAGRNYNYTERALEYIHSYSNADISLDDLCTELNLSRYHFIRIFKAHTGTTPHAYLLDLRLTHSMQYLKKKDYSLSEVASLCGFMSQAHYSQCFRKKYGVTPTHFRDLDKS
jgi:AraC family transcriptional regulator